jgi:hypothetical protein
MNKNITINTYDDLVRERERLKDLLKVQRTQIQRDFNDLKDEFKPVIHVSSTLGKLLSREDGKDPVVAAGTNIGIDLLTTTLFSKSNFLLRLILPAILKNLSSHYLPKPGPVIKKPIVKKQVLVTTH